jgi:hypothetical protein
MPLEPLADFVSRPATLVAAGVVRRNPAPSR